MSFSLIFTDELKGFYKSKVMIALWIIFPLITILVHYLTPGTTGDIPLSLFTSILISSIGGLLASIILTVQIIHEKDARAYDLFLIRPIKRWHIMVSKYLAVLLCVIVAISLALSVGIAIDLFQNEVLLDFLLPSIIDSFIMTISIISISCAFGVLIGVVSPSIVVGVLIVVFIGQYVQILPMIPSIMGINDPAIFVSLTGILVTIILMAMALIAFEKKQF